MEHGRVTKHVEIALVIVALVAPVVALALRRSRDRRPSAAILALGIFVLDELVLGLPRAGVFAGLRWNWQGKLAEIALVGVALAIRLADGRAIGATTPLRPRSLRPTLAVFALFVALPLGFVLLGARELLGPEGWIFQASMPGLAEELVYRGLLLALFDRAFGRPWRVLGAEVGWGLVVTSLLFALVHALSVSSSGQVQVEPLLALGPLIGGLAGAWLRARTDSVWPGVVGHDLSNLTIPLVTLLR